MRKTFLIISVALAFTSPGYSETTGASPAAVAEDFIHRGTGFAFPPQSGSFERSRTHVFASDGLHTGVEYVSSQPGHEMSVTLEVYPTPYLIRDARSPGIETDACTDGFIGLEQEILRKVSGARRIDTGIARSPSSLFEGTGRRSAFAIQGISVAGKEPPRQAETQLFCFFGGHWMISYIAAAPPGNDLKTDLTRFQTALQWPNPHSADPAEDRTAIILVRIKGSDRTYLLNGMIATGTIKELSRFEAASAERDIKTSRVAGSPPQSMAFFDVMTKARMAVDFARRVRSGAFGKLGIEFMLLPLEALQRPGDPREAIEVAAADQIDGL